MLKFNKNFFLKFILIIFLFSLYSIFSAIQYCNSIFNDFSSNIFRLHIIANSNSQIDQTLKYTIRNKILNYVDSLPYNIKSQKESIDFFKNHINDFKKIADSTIKDFNLNYSSNIEIKNFYFPTKFYGDISFPSGYYNGLKINLGKAQGQNWWCVMFPPLCFNNLSCNIVPEKSKDFLKDNLQLENYNLITENNDKINFKIKFKIVEIIEKIKENLNNF